MDDFTLDWHLRNLHGWTDQDFELSDRASKERYHGAVHLLPGFALDHDDGWSDGDGEESWPVQYCEWFALCTNPADGSVHHPVLGPVPCCSGCADKLDLTLAPNIAPDEEVRV